MAINYDDLINLAIAETEQTMTERDCILYALGIGIGFDPENEEELPFVYEKKMKVMPTQATVLAYPGFWIRDLDTGIDWKKVVNGEQGFMLHRPLRAGMTVRSRTRVTEVLDKGAGNGALVYSERTIVDVADNALVATVSQTTFCRGEGGFGGPTGPQPLAHPLPARAPDLVCDLPTRPETALIYRLSGDLNPLHSDPNVAKAAGYPRPILHGLATFGLAGHAILRSVCKYEPARLRSCAARFSAPVFPGETIRTEIWVDANVLSFRCTVPQRAAVVLSNGRAEVADVAA